MDITKWDKKFMEIALSMAEMSHCAAKKVCCLLVRDGQIISSGINGTHSGQPNCDDKFVKNSGIWSTKIDDLWFVCSHSEEHHDWSLDNEIHAEQNAIAKAAKNGISTEGATAYVTLSPCNSCAKLLISAGIKRVVFSDVYDDAPEAFKLLEKCGIETIIL